MSTIRGDGSTIPSGVGSVGSGTVHAGGGDISSGYGPTTSGTVHAGGPGIASGYGPVPAFAGVAVDIGAPIVVNTITYKYEGVISKSTTEAEIFLLSHNSKKCVFKLYYPNFKPKEDILKHLKELKHEDIINVIDYGYYHDRFFEIMDYAEGGTLQQHTPIKDVSRLKKIIAETVNAYKFCHSKGIVHKDIKPENLYFKNADGTDIVIGDFGISSSLDGGMSRHLTSQSLTVGYAAPEMYGIPDEKTGVVKIYIGNEVDYYALGITVIHIWNGKSPFDGFNIHAIANITTSGSVCIPEDLPKDMLNLVKGLITVDLAKRWGYEEIQRWLDGEDVPVHFQVIEISYPPFYFSPSEVVATTEELVKILKKNPSDVGKKKLYSGKISAWINLFDQRLAADLDSIVEDDYPKDQDAGFQKAIYLLDLDEPFAQNGKVCRTSEELAGVLEADFSYYLNELGKSSHRFYLYLEAHDSKKEADTFRKYFQTFSTKKALNTIILELRGRESFTLGGELFVTPEELLKYKDQQFLVNELKDKESRVSLWIDGTSFHEIKKQLETWRGLKICDETTLSYVSAGNGIPLLEIGKISFSYSDLRIGASFADSFSINNNGGGVLSGPITSDKKWLRVSQGKIDTNRHKQDIDFTVDTANLPFGFKETGKIEIQSNVGIEIVEVDISIELGIKAAARFRMGMTFGGSILGALFGLILHKFNFTQSMNEAVCGIAGLTGIIFTASILGERAKRLKGNPAKTVSITVIGGLLFFGFLKFYFPLGLSLASWALLFASIAYLTSPSILKSLQVGKKKILGAVGVGTVALSAVIIFFGSEVANQSYADKKDVLVRQVNKTTKVDTAVAAGQVLPALPFIERDKEIDLYAGKWRLKQSYPFYAKEGDTTPIKTLSAGTNIEGLSLAVHTLSYEVVEIGKPRTIELWSDKFTTQGREIFRMPLRKGDKIATLSYFGEGECRVWVKGRVYISECPGNTPGVPVDALTTFDNHSGETKTVHWALVRTPDGLKGWLKDVDYDGVQGISRHDETVEFDTNQPATPSPPEPTDSILRPAVKLSPPQAPIPQQQTTAIDPAKLEGEINRELRSQNVSGVTAQVSDDISVTLKGAGSVSEKERAMQVVSQFRGIRAVKDKIFVVE